ncbi:hypothetical protein K466DRAFT_662814 [Polyporus arcularius HHB13444]|uniref:Uncharacterized protein n=1 Tax=Polyporus arcularius HHB13444 TaxID=1314778 RepID=A0A5C3PHK3_9APHY|nr:hypothetical protein K466DRAFT_662814 [Polyporus arcularius HHB13444]
MDYLAQSIGDAFPAFDANLSEEEKALLAEGLVDSTQLQRWAAARIKEYKERIQSLKSVYNAGAPINRKLPREVLAEIFSHFHPGYDLHDRDIKLLGVCRLWRHLILRTPAFWANILSRERHMHPRIRDRALGRLKLLLPLTRAHPLTLWFQGVPHELVRALSPHTSRISSLTVGLAKHTDLVSLNDLLQGGMPHLEHLEVSHCPYMGGLVPPLKISRRKFPLLRSLTVPFEGLGLACLDSDLRSLDVSECRCEECRGFVTKGTQRTLSEVIELCPSLRRLKIKNILRAWGPLDRTIALPSLCELRIEEHRGDLGTFLACLSYPPTCAVHVGTSAHTTIRACLPPNPTSWPQLSETDEVRLSMVYGGWTVLTTFARGNQRLRVGVHVKTTALGTVTEVSRLFTPSAGITSLTVDPDHYPFMQSSDDPGTAFRAMLAAFPHLTHLNIGAYDGRRVMRLLSETTTAEMRYCPKLEELRFVWYYGDDELYESREGLGAGRSSSPSRRHKAGAIVLSVFCDIAVQMLDRRRAAGKSLKKLFVGVYPEVVTESLYVDTEGWEPSVLEQRLRRHLTGYEDIVHVFPVKVED